jgi:hypothetical protein
MDSIKVTFRDAKGNDIKTIEGNEGDDLLSLAHEHDVDLEGASGFPILLSPSSSTLSGRTSSRFGRPSHRRIFSASRLEVD